MHLDITLTRKKTSREELETAPGIEQTMDMFRLYGGAVLDAAPQTIQLGDGTQLQVRDESLKNIHIRGGRGGEILYMVDGMPVTHPIYGGRDVLDLNIVDVKEIELLTGAFNAEYGQAQSGVVNITTRSGGEEFMGGVEYKTDEFKVLGESYETKYTSFYLGGPEPITRNLLPKLGLKIPGKMNFFISGNGNLTNTPYNNNRDRDSISLLGVNIKGKQSNTGNLNAKVNWRLTNQLELTMSYHGSWKRWDNFTWLWKYYPNHMAEYSRNNNNANFKIVHTLSKSTYYTLNFGYLSVDYIGSLNGKRPADFWTFFKDDDEYDYWTYTKNYTDAPDSLKRSIKAPEKDPLTGFYDKLSNVTY